MELVAIQPGLQSPASGEESTVQSPAGAAWRRKRQRGSAILEGALVFLPFMAIAFAIMDYSLGIFVQSILMNSVREGVRYAITQQTAAGGQDAAIKTVIKNNSFGFVNNSNINLVTIKYYKPGNLAEVTGSGSNGAGNIVVITVTGFPWTWFAPIWRPSSAFTFTVSSSDVMGAPPAGILPTR